jgi:hypothetical protein
MNNNTLIVLEPMFMALLIGGWVWVFYSLYNHPERLPKSKVWRVVHWVVLIMTCVVTLDFAISKDFSHNWIRDVVYAMGAVVIAFRRDQERRYSFVHLVLAGLLLWSAWQSYNAPHYPIRPATIPAAVPAPQAPPMQGYVRCETVNGERRCTAGFEPMKKEN